MKTIEENRKLKEERFRQQCITYKSKANDLIKENQKLEKLNFATVKDSLELKYQNGIEEQKKYEELEKLKQDNTSLLTDEKEGEQYQGDADDIEGPDEEN